MRTQLIAGNWKMNKTVDESIELVKSLSKLITKTDREVVICPPFTVLSAVSKLLFGYNIDLGAQSLSEYDDGAYTGEISAKMLKDIGCKYVIIGHSERRKLYYENDEAVNKKVKQALKYGLTPIVCVGETLEEREDNETNNVLLQQIKESLKDIDTNKIVIAYEPVWAIGTGKTATPMEAQQVHAFIRKLIRNNNTRILYGGSVKPNNIKDLMKMPDIDGALVGGASLEADSFAKIVNY